MWLLSCLNTKTLKVNEKYKLKSNLMLNFPSNHTASVWHEAHFFSDFLINATLYLCIYKHSYVNTHRMVRQLQAQPHPHLWILHESPHTHTYTDSLAPTIRPPFIVCGRQFAFPLTPEKGSVNNSFMFMCYVVFLPHFLVCSKKLNPLERRARPRNKSCLPFIGI